jgi:hypothetical protein
MPSSRSQPLVSFLLTAEHAESAERVLSDLNHREALRNTEEDRDLE